MAIQILVIAAPDAILAVMKAAMAFEIEGLETAVERKERAPAAAAAETILAGAGVVLYAAELEVLLTAGLMENLRKNLRSISMAFSAAWLAALQIFY